MAKQELAPGRSEGARVRARLPQFAVKDVLPWAEPVRDSNPRTLRTRLSWSTLPKLALLLPILSCLLVAWVISAILAFIWAGIALFSRQDPPDYDI